jgi:hypothetical protein
LIHSIKLKKWRKQYLFRFEPVTFWSVVRLVCHNDTVTVTYRWQICRFIRWLYTRVYPVTPITFTEINSVTGQYRCTICWFVRGSGYRHAYLTMHELWNKILWYLDGLVNRINRLVDVCPDKVYDRLYLYMFVYTLHIKPHSLHFITSFSVLIINSLRTNKTNFRFA